MSLVLGGGSEVSLCNPMSCCRSGVETLFTALTLVTTTFIAVLARSSAGGGQKGGEKWPRDCMLIWSAMEVAPWKGGSPSPVVHRSEAVRGEVVRGECHEDEPSQCMLCCSIAGIKSRWGHSVPYGMHLSGLIAICGSSIIES
eukprot:3380611-Amphidinium_carterae.2